MHGLLHGYSPSRSKDEEHQRHIHVHKRRPGAKARELEALRRAKREQAQAEADEQAPLAAHDLGGKPLCQGLPDPHGADQPIWFTDGHLLPYTGKQKVHASYRLEPVQQPACRCAQEQLCRKPTGLGAKIPGGK